MAAPANGKREIRTNVRETFGRKHRIKRANGVERRFAASAPLESAILR
jgi:hypothetical protein